MLLKVHVTSVFCLCNGKNMLKTIGKHRALRTFCLKHTLGNRQKTVNKNSLLHAVVAAVLFKLQVTPFVYLWNGGRWLHSGCCIVLETYTLEIARKLLQQAENKGPFTLRQQRAIHLFHQQQAKNTAYNVFLNSATSPC